MPGIAFWSSLRQLKFLILHDNPLGKYETLQNIATCPNLIGLTMYDTPLGLKRNYRHHVVNSIWSLKALDHYVISDEEIIEDAVFGGQFVTLNGNFKIDLCPKWYEVCIKQFEIFLRDRPFNLKGGGYGFLFRSEIFFRTTQELEYLFF